MRRSLKNIGDLPVLFDKKRQVPAPNLRPFAFKTQDGFLVGLAMDPEEGAPCVNCVKRWLTERNVWLEESLVADLPPRAREILSGLVGENTAHTFYEVLTDGSKVRLDSVVFPHPKCDCNKKMYCGPEDIKKNSNFAFSPIYRLRCVRYGTPSGNLWFFTATGKAPATGRVVTAFGIHPNKQQAKIKAVEQWMKKVAPLDLASRMNDGISASREDIVTGNSKIVSQNDTEPSSIGMGAGDSKEMAVIEALTSLARYQTLKTFTTSGKKPMMVVGAHSWLRARVPFFLLQQYDLHLMFYPTSSPVWVAGLIALSRTDTTEAPVCVFSSEAHPMKVLESVIYKVLERCYPADAKDLGKPKKEEKKKSFASQMHLWWTNWIYRCPKITLKDVLMLEPYSNTLDQWQTHLKENKKSLSFLHMNHPTLPSKIKYLVKILLPETERYDGLSNSHNVTGIHTWSSIETSLMG